MKRNYFANKGILTIASIFIISIVFITSCKDYDNFTTYFNTYYNMERIMKEVEEEFDFQDEKLRVEPRVFVPKPEVFIPEKETSRGLPPFCREYIVTKAKRMPVNIKLDSMLIKGSKVISKHPKSEYVEGSLYLMAKTFFYKEEWLPCQIKCGEQIDKFPAGVKSPDAHILLAKALLIQRKFEEGKIILSRTVDIAWQLKRYDILSEAFRLEAELYLYIKDYDKAVRPYKQAIVQSLECDLKARWQLDLAALVFEIGKFDKALNEFRKVRRYCPDYLQKFESYLYEAECLAHIGKFDEADAIVEDVTNDGKWEEWKANIEGTKLNVLRMKMLDSADTNNDGIVDVSNDSLMAMEKISDSTFTNNPSISAYYYQRAVDYYSNNDLREARNYFAKAKTSRSPIIYKANLMHLLLNKLDRKQRLAEFDIQTSDSIHLVDDSTKGVIAQSYYEIARVFENLHREDSSLFYYKKALEIAPKNVPETGKYYFTYSERVRERDPYTADSLLEILIADYSRTAYGEEAMRKSGFIVPAAVDTAGELYNSGFNLYKFKNYRFALEQFDSLYRTYPTSDFAPKSLYTMGWIFEKEYEAYDTAMYYYQKLIDKYPNSEYAKDIVYTIDMKSVVDAGIPIPDSLMPKQIVRKTRPKVSKPKLDPNLNKSKSKTAAQALNPNDLLKNPGKFFDKPMDLLKNPFEALKKAGKEMFSDSTSIINFNNPLDKLKNDSTNSKSKNVKDSSSTKEQKDSKDSTNFKK